MPHAQPQVGLANQSVPLYLSEMAPPKMRGGLNNLFQVAKHCWEGGSLGELGSAGSHVALG